MYETEDELQAMQELLDRSYATAGSHLLSIHTPERRSAAADVAGRLQGMCLLVLATVTSDGRPIGGPVDGIFYRGSFHFGSSPDSLRFRHIRKRPYVTATHLPTEEFAVTVHGRAVPLDMRSEENAGLRQALLDLYGGEYGPEWEQFLDASLYARIEAERMYAFSLPAASHGS